jgi:hypothetical protein
LNYAKIAYKFLIFVAMGGFFYLYGLPQKAEFVSKLLRTARHENREDKLKGLAEERIRGEICSINDLCEYRPINWTLYPTEDSASTSLLHEFYTNGRKRTFLFRMRYGNLSEVIDMN